MSDLPESPILAKPETLLRVPVGLSSPLWGFYAGAAASGAAWWWMTRWARPENLEALFGQAARVEAVVLETPVLEAPAELIEAVAPPTAPVVEAAPEPVEAALEPVEAVLDPVEVAEEVAAEPAASAVVEPPILDEPVGGEAAPITPALATEPVVEAEPEPAPAPKPRLRKVEPRTD